ncbi:MAG: acyltransferase [Cyanobacteria bacterium J06600_6]
MKLPRQRLSGIDLWRGIAIFAVILVHADEGVSDLPYLWQILLNFAEFAVPFFLATSFWLTVGKIQVSQKTGWLKSRIAKLILSYLIWSLIYLGYKIAKYTVAQEPDNWRRILADPLGIMFQGNAAFHLYFLPLLISGTMLLSLLPTNLFWSRSVTVTIVATIASLIIYQLGIDIESRNPLINQPPIFEVFGRWLFWGIRCLPYIAVATLLHHPQLKFYTARPSKFKTFVWLILFLVINSISWHSLDSCHELLRGYSTLILAIFISQHRFCLNPAIASLSKCSFGIYLIHLIWIESGQIIEARLLSEPWRVSTPGLLLFTIVCFCLSWLTVEMLMRRRYLAQIIFST